MKNTTNFLLLTLFSLCSQAFPLSQNQQQHFNEATKIEGSSGIVDLQYHMGPVLTSSINLYIIWYGGHWNPSHQSTIRDFLHSISSTSDPHPSVSDWWQTVRLYTDQTGSNITNNVVLSGEFHDLHYSHGMFLTRLSMQSIIETAVTSNPNGLPLNFRNGLYLILTAPDVQVQDFCRAVCGFHYFTYSSIVGITVPYAWVGYSGTQCPGMCAYPFAWPEYSGRPPSNGNGGNDLMKPPNGDAGVDGMISVIAHELAESSSNPLVNAWYAGDDPTAPTEIADLCLGVYGSGGDGDGYVGAVYKDAWGNGYNVNGVRGSKFLVQWVWDPVSSRCFGPNAMD